MNIFTIEGVRTQIDWVRSARSLDNLRVVKMLVESTQLLCCALNFQGVQTPYKTTHRNSPSSLWVVESSRNWEDLRIHANALLLEYWERFDNRPHRCERVLRILDDLYQPQRFPSQTSTPIRLAMPEEFKDPLDPVTSYRRYYSTKPNMRYPRSRIPKWFLEFRGTLPFVILEDL